LYLTAASIICINLPILDAKVETIILLLQSLIIPSRLSPIIFSEIECPGLVALVLSHIKIFTHSCHILEIFPISAGLSIDGV
jgi:hypothetical protein